MPKVRIVYWRNWKKLEEWHQSIFQGIILPGVEYEDIRDLERGVENLEFLKEYIEEVGCKKYLDEAKGAKIMEILGQSPGIWYRYLRRLRRIYGEGT